MMVLLPPGSQGKAPNYFKRFCITTVLLSFVVVIIQSLCILQDRQLNRNRGDQRPGSEMFNCCVVSQSLVLG